jgi:hypothetical protein
MLCNNSNGECRGHAHLQDSKGQQMGSGWLFNTSDSTNRPSYVQRVSTRRPQLVSSATRKVMPP